MDNLGRDRVQAGNVVNNTETEVKRQSSVTVVKNTETGVAGIESRPTGAFRSLGKMMLGGVKHDRQSARELTREIESELERGQNELGRDQNELEYPLTHVGEETALLKREREEADLEDLRNEENLPPVGATEAERRLVEFQHSVVKKTDTEITREVKEQVEQILRRPVFNPAELESLRFRAMVADLSGADAYKFGQGNIAA